ncbi:heme lyase CcmF/NrfE family subunit [Marinivivus vitaminiproducens]|uniref:heme lyase CcmF/NrfE family subunit n=1 Tax=Marinivivus vitaminiproducens TaxID=3035935 RepID=UPI0027A38FA7|nr:heme lyase CcmF/NrfE family subunit [Geminicoccaceae bacterium SCSIO 64248]
MIAELGHYLLVLAFGLSLVQGSLPLVGARGGDVALMRLGQTAAMGQFIALTLAFAVLLYVFAVSDFSVALVASNSHSLKPFLYKLAGAWGNHEGSLLMWVWMLALYGGAVALFGRNLPPPFRARVLAIQGLIGVGFLAFMLLTSNPFLRLDPAPFDGRGLNPVLQDPALAFHPPMLYLGYVGFSMAFAFAVAALIEGRVDASWARWVRPWTLAAWVSLTIGIALGSYWAYYELGWGGWWFWDPVENASFMPWLAGTALLHSATVVEKRNTLKSWTVLLAILTFSLSLLGAFLVRSGILTSVHAFAVDPSRGTFILVLLAIAIGGAFALYAWRAPSLQGGGMFAPISREGGLLLNNLLLATGCAVVFLGTLYPLFLDAVGGGRISVGPPYFNATFVPIMTVLLALVPIGSLLSWKRGDLAGVLGKLKFAGAAVLFVVLGSLVFCRGFAGLGLLGLVLGVWVIAGTAVELGLRVLGPRPASLDLSVPRIWRRARAMPRSAWGMATAHVGLGVFVLGVTASSAWQSERIVTLEPGQAVEMAGYRFELRAIGDRAGPNYSARTADILVTRSGVAIAELRPEKRFYPAEQQQTTEAGIRSLLKGDLYAVLGDATGQSDQSYAFRLYFNPLVSWLWGGICLMGLGGLVSLTDRRHRVGAPVPSRHAAPGAGTPVPA